MDMQNKFEPMEPAEKVPRIPEGRSDLSQELKPFNRAAASDAAAPSQPVPLSTAQRREVPATLLRLEARPLSAYDDNPVFEELSAARFLGIRADTLKKWRQRNQGPDYIQYGPNGAVRYELKALMEFRDRHRVRLGN
jgi:hypothetical protein